MIRPARRPPSARRLRLETLESRAVLSAAGDCVSLVLSVNGQLQAIPANIGVAADGSRAEAYTLAADGQVFFDPATGTTLGDFFATWRTAAGLAGNRTTATFSPTELLGTSINAERSLQMFVNGQVVDSYEQTPLTDGDQIALVLGSNPVVALGTNFGPLVFELFADAAPLTAANFLNYVNDGDYANSFFHRSVPGFVLQGGGFRTASPTFSSTAQFSAVPADPPVLNEPGVPNAKGTVAMAKLGNQPNSATSQFFVNLADNPGLDVQNGGFTVFGRVLDMAAVNAIAGLPVNNTNPSPYDELPLAADNRLAVVQFATGLGTISGTAYRDANGNGVRDDGESGLSGAVVYADANDNGQRDAGEDFATTDAQGRYRLQTGPGSVAVRSAPLPGAVVSGANVRLVTVALGRVESGRDFGQRIVAAADAYATEVGQTLVLSAAEGVLANDPGWGTGELAARSAVPPQNGSLTLQSNGALSYLPNPGFVGADVFSYTVSNGQQESAPVAVTLSVGPTAASSISGSVYLDLDGDGAAEAGEPGVPGVRITLTGSDDSGSAVQRTVLTDDAGSFAFAGLAAGVYQLQERQPALLRDGLDSATVGGAIVENDVIRQIAAGPQSQLAGFRFAERSLTPQHASIVWQFASTARNADFFRDQIASAERYAGNSELADAIRPRGAAGNVAPETAAPPVHSSLPPTAELRADDDVPRDSARRPAPLAVVSVAAPSTSAWWISPAEPPPAPDDAALAAAFAGWERNALPAPPPPAAVLLRKAPSESATSSDRPPSADSDAQRPRDAHAVELPGESWGLA